MNAVAYHEAGHAVGYWLVGQGHRTLYANLSDDGTGQVGTSFTHTDDSVDVARMMAHRDGELAAVYQKLIGLMLGPVAERRVSPDWPGECLLSGDWFSDWESDDGSDAAQIMYAVSLVHSTGGRRLLMLRTAGQWCDELLDDSRVWERVEWLAERLILDRHVDGDAIGKRFTDGWSDTWPPVVALGKQWRRRLFRNPSIAQLERLGFRLPEPVTSVQ